MTPPAFITMTNLPAKDDRLTVEVKNLAAALGLGVVAISTADAFPNLGDMLVEHIDRGYVDGMDWFTPERARFSADPRNLQTTARSMITVGVPYWNGPVAKPNDTPRGRISRYAWGNDYHAVLRKRMLALHRAIEEIAGRPLETRLLVDTARIVDRAAAARAGLGWYGKHACLIVPGHGSWVMLGTMLLDLDLTPGQPLDRNCGRCSICIDRCPTGAIVAPYTVNAPRCLSFQTIEQRGAIPLEIRPLLGDWVFGCDICQDVCPYTAAAAVLDDPDFRPANPDRAFPSLDWLLSMKESEFREVFRGSAVLRAKRRGLARNAAVALANQPSDRAERILSIAVQEHDEPLVRGHAAWGLGAIDTARARRLLDRVRLTEQDSGVVVEIEMALSFRR